MILQIIAASLLALSQPQYEITVYEPQPMQQTEYVAIWLDEFETVQGSMYTVRDGEDWFYVHRDNYESGWLKFEYGEMKLTRVKNNKQLVLIE